MPAPKKKKTVRGELAKRKVARSLKGVDPEEAQQIAEDLAQAKETEIEDRQERYAGQVVGKFKVPFTLKDLEDKYPLVTFTPEETIRFTLNGVVRQFIAGYECTVPECFKILYDRRKQQMVRRGKQLPDLGYVNMEQPGAGTLD